MVIGRPWTAREGSERSHLNPSTRRVLCWSCYTSGCIVEITPSIPGPKPNISHAGHLRDEPGSVLCGSLPCLTDRCSRESSITVQPCDGLARSVLEPRMRASSTCIDERLLHMACHLGRRLCHADRLSAKSILARQRAVRQGGSESIGHEPGKSQAEAFEFSTPIHTATRIPHLVLYRWLPGPRHHQSACACERLAWTWSFRLVPRFKAQVP